MSTPAAYDMANGPRNPHARPLPVDEWHDPVLEAVLILIDAHAIGVARAKAALS